MRHILHTDRRGSISRRIAGLAAAAALGLALTSCAGGGGSSAGGNATTGRWAGPKPVAGYEKVAEPGPAIDVSSLAGKTVYWIPITTQAPIFTVENKAALQAFTAAGVHLQLCDGKASPDAVAACVSQAINANAAGIIATSIPPEFAKQAFAGAAEAGLSLLFVNTPTAEVPAEWGPKVAALPSNFVAQERTNADIIIADSKGTANVLLVGVSDSSVTTYTFEQGMKAPFKEHCPGCKVSEVQSGTTTLSTLASQVSAALAKDPGIGYIMVQYDSFAPPVVQALRQLNKGSSVKLFTALGQLDGMQRLADGSQFVDTGYSIAALGWNQADAMLRLLLGDTPHMDAYVTPIRTHTTKTVQGLPLTDESWLSGTWSSDDDFRAMFTHLWGVN